MPIEKSPNLLECWDFIYERTIGCVGILKDWLSRALKLALENNDDVLEMNHLRNTALSINKISKLVDEVAQGEICFIETSEKILDVRTKLGIDNTDIRKNKYSKKKV